jgi:hypothetical protein
MSTERARERAEDLLRILRAFVNPVEVMHGVTVRLDMKCLHDDAAKLLKEIDDGIPGQA